MKNKSGPIFFSLWVFIGSLPALAAEIAPPKISGLLQAWQVGDTTAVTVNKINYRIRRAEIGASGSLVEHTRYFVKIDAAKATSLTDKILQDVGVGFSPITGLEFLVGQFKTQTTAEGLVSSAELLFLERALVARKFGDIREPGILTSYTHEYFKLAAMLSNGQGTNKDSTFDRKDLSLRAEVMPLSWVNWGTFLLLSEYQYDQKGRWGTNLSLKPDNFVFNAEFAMGKDATVKSLGLALDAGYTFAEAFQPVVRFELFKPDTDNTLVAYAETLGLNYLLSKNQVKIQGAVTLLQDAWGKDSGSYDVKSGTSGTLVTLAFQAAF